ncbi:helix-turn-helix domain-containing protein [Clostridium septicum]|uniref:helix-turn-helix domain-containing protein n=1 Tax=Clostridium septicum TaxID=1504 RepID=UPI00082E8B56|nr:helix-turn-helix domain-containing protein [Clostridium septicum]
MLDILSLGENSIYKNGYGIVSKLVMRDKNLSPESKAIYAYICSFAGSGTTAFPSAELMMSELKMSKNRFYKFRKELELNGYITVCKQRNGNRRERNIYMINSNISQRLQNEDIQVEDIQNEDIQVEDIQNEPCNNNSINNNSINNNSINNNNIYKDLDLKGISKTDKDSILKFCIENNVAVVVAKEKLNIIKTSRSLTNKVGAFIAAVKNNWSKTENNNKSIDKTSNLKFVQGASEENKYNESISELEKKLLGWD